ncbi:membrane protein [Arthrobacter phage Qui]|uniref:Membrane protein n=1 Tax=Arthrobacter phage Qui TaxID=2603260 RepID=A0A5B8WFR6_9CAUD|nr:membrane protein [Arthrobacter phage Qui]QED11660.1 membrane protein [Arthrobacter phage Qui]QOC56491.1 membrane protein [Arthrobacter phage Paella]
MSEKTDKIKKHFRDHKEAYITGGVCLVVGAAVTYLVVKGNDVLENDEVVKFVNIIRGDHNTINQVVEVHMVRPGPKSFMVQCLETQKTWPSIRAAAEDLGLNPGELSKHLRGLTDSVKGFTFEKVAEL